jgi:hypothetical protein
MFDADQEYSTEPEIVDAAARYHDYYKARLPKDFLSRLVGAHVFSPNAGHYRFRYPYYFYFFVARYFRDNIQLEDHAAALRSKINEMVDHIHYEQYSNVLTFYVYLSKDLAAINRVRENAAAIYDDLSPCDFDLDVQFVNDLYTKGSKPIPLMLPKATPEQNRDEYRLELDKVEDVDWQDGYDCAQGEKVKYDKQLSDITKVNIATKTLQILGQVARNSPGSLAGDVKRQVVSEAYLLGLRTLNAVLQIPATRMDSMRQYIAELIKEHRAIQKAPALISADLARMVDQGLIALTQAYAFGMIRKISQAVGLRQLEDIYSDVLADLDAAKEISVRVSARLIDLAIKLDHFSDPPEREIFDLDRLLRENYYAHTTLRDLVFAYLYLRQADHKTRSRLMSRFKIGSAGGKLIDNPEKRQRGQR